ncbi:efflux RND transporter periplasmic adaptor subunit [Nevskia soli]|uniref:efflux RND transporter periplasmic adaptor subunit n=1 Tax=Nevskia soli TaxID=418856 RepID=UPI00056932E0|nr:efflux RND transporter periplasmic adaptor subunit [Nevskia soli]
MQGWFSRNKAWFIVIALILGLVLVLGGIKGYRIYSMIQGFKAQGVPKQTVSSMKAAFEDWRPQLTAVGSLRAERGADLSAEVSGIVDSIQFKSGDEVKAGQLLMQLRSADDVAHLESLKASAALAETVYNRDKAQFQAEAISQAVLDSDAANLRSAKAQVAEQQAIVDKKFIRAPFGGKLGIRAVDLGQYLSPGTKIVNLQQLDPIFVDFYLPQQALAQIVIGQKVATVSDTFPDLTFNGEIAAIDPQVDTDTRNVQVRAMVKNPEHKLLPGMFAKVTIEVGEQQRYLTLPQNAITFNPYGEAVFIVTTAGKLQQESDAKTKAEGGKPAAAAPGAPATDPQQLVAKQVFVTVGPTRGDQIAILKGVEEGQEVVTSGQLKLKTGTAIVINNAVQPANDPNPKPVEE